jgi:hypothetical protein
MYNHTLIGGKAVVGVGQCTALQGELSASRRSPTYVLRRDNEKGLADADIIAFATLL